MFAMAVLAVLVLPGMARQKAYSSKIGCVNNLKQVGLAFRMWSGDNGDRFPMDVSTIQGGTEELVNKGEPFRHFQVLSNELGTPKVVVCPSDGRSPATNFASDFSDSHVSYFVGLNATLDSTNAFLSGDRKLEDDSGALSGIRDLTSKQNIGWTKPIHDDRGHIAFVDGSVNRFTTRELKKALVSTGLATNRLAFPGGAN